jgi:copper(I)-binding protein
MVDRAHLAYMRPNIRFGGSSMRFRILLLSLMALLPATAHAQEATSKGVTVANAWARATPGGATVGAVFLEIRTDKKTSDRLTGIASPAADKTEIHSSSMDGGVMKMRRLDTIDLKPGKTIALKPMGDHIMLFGLKQPLKEGGTVDLTLTFEKAGAIAVKAGVKGIAAMGPAAHQHHSGGSMDSMSHDGSMSHD